MPRADEVPALCLSLRVKLLHRAVDQIYETQLRPLGLGTSQFTLLVSLANHPSTPTELGRSLLMEKSTLSRTLERMRRAGWLEAHASSGGLRLNAAGRAKLAEALPAWARAQALAASLLGEGFSAPLDAAVERLKRLRSTH